MAKRLLVTGLTDLRTLVLALPKLAAVRSVYDGHITVATCFEGVDLVERLKVADKGLWQPSRTWLGWWLQKLCRGFNDMINGRKLTAAGALSFANVASIDTSFVAPASPYAFLIAPQGWPDLRMASLARKWILDGYGVIFLADNMPADARRRVIAACPEARDLTGIVSLAEVVPLAQRAAAVVGGRDGVSYLAALAGARIVIITQARDKAAEAVLPPHSTVWLIGEDMPDIGVSDVLKAAG